MSTVVAIKTFNLTFADLIRICNDVHQSMSRDVTQFTSYGITSTVIAQFETDIDAFEDFPTDSELEDLSVLATEAKNVFRASVFELCRSFERRAALTWGTSNRKYNGFYMKNLSVATDNNLLVFARAVSRSAELYKTELAGAGVTQAMIDDLVNLCQSFEDSFDAQKDANDNRDDATINRTNMANDLYAKLSKYCETGKLIWQGVNQARYNDYVIYNNTQNDAPTRVRNFRYDFDRFEWDAASRAETYEIQTKETSAGGDAWESIGELAQTYFGYQRRIGSWDFRVRAKNYAGDGDWSEVILLNVPIPQPITNLSAQNIPADNLHPHTIKLTWTLPDGVGSVNIYRAHYNGTYNNPQPTNFQQVDSVSGNEWGDNTFLPLHNNMLYYYVTLTYNGDEIPNSQSNIAWVNLSM